MFPELRRTGRADQFWERYPGVKTRLKPRAESCCLSGQGGILVFVLAFCASRAISPRELPARLPRTITSVTLLC